METNSLRISSAKGVAWQRFRRRFACSLMAMCATLVASNSFAYRTLNDRAGSEDLPPIRWQTSTLELAVSSRAPILSVSDVQAALADVSQKWSPSCSTLTVRPAATLSRAAAAGDGVNTISWVES